MNTTSVMHAVYTGEITCNTASVCSVITAVNIRRAPGLSVSLQFMHTCIRTPQSVCVCVCVFVYDYSPVFPLRLKDCPVAIVLVVTPTSPVRMPTCPTFLPPHSSTEVRDGLHGGEKERAPPVMRARGADMLWVLLSGAALTSPGVAQSLAPGQCRWDAHVKRFQMTSVS